MSENGKVSLNRNRAGDFAIHIIGGNGIGINKSVLNALGRPDYLLFWWGVSEKVLAISPADRLTELSIPVPKYFYGTRNGSKIKNWKLMRALAGITGWAYASNHRLNGEYIPGLNIIAFRIDDAREEL